MMQSIPARCAIADFFASVLRPGTTTAATPASCHFFSDDRDVLFLQAEDDVRPEECSPDQCRVLGVHGERAVDPFQEGEHPGDIRRSCIEPKAEVDDICAPAKYRSTPSRISSCNGGHPSPQRALSSGNLRRSLARGSENQTRILFHRSSRWIASSAFFAARNSSAGTVREREMRVDAREGSVQDPPRGGARGIPAHPSRVPPVQKMPCTSRGR